MKKLWNRPDYPVWSISTHAPEEALHNMNICTYAIAATMKPKEFMVAIYHNTYTHKLARRHPYILMQLLAKEHHDIVRRFGFQSGRNKIYTRSHQSIRHFPGVIDPRPELFPSVPQKYYPSFFSYWKAVQKIYF